MSKALKRGWLGVAGLLIYVVIVKAVRVPASTEHPLTATRILALTAGGTLPENIVAAVQARGLNFTPNEDYKKQLEQAGATHDVLNAVANGKVHPASPEEQEETKESQPSWAHFAAAAKLLRNKQYKEAESEMDQVVKEGKSELEAGFVMGEALRREEKWEKSAAIYNEILRQEPLFPEAETKLSFVLYRLGDANEALRAAKAVLQAAPNNAEAHKNAGLALESLRRNDAAVAEYREALRLKPDYSSVHYDLGLLLYNTSDFDGSIVEYKKALTLEPGAADTHFNIALAYERKNDGDNAIRELREAVRLSPKDIKFRQELGSQLIEHNLNADAVTELRALEAIAPESAVCHLCLGVALMRTNDYVGARQELEIAVRLDPSDPNARRELGRTYEAEEKYDLALREYNQAERMDPELTETHLCVARVLLHKKQAKAAANELKEALDLDPSNPLVHQQYGEALEADGQMEQAKSEYKEAVLLDGNNAFSLLDLARIQEKQGDWPGGMGNYRMATQKVGEQLMKSRGPQIAVDAAGALKAAQVRFEEHLSQLRASGKGKEAEALLAKVEATAAGASVSTQLDAAMAAGADAFQKRKFDEAERSYEEAVKIAQQVQPHDARLVMSLGFLSSLRYYRKDLTGALAILEQQLKASEEVFGPGSPQTSPVLESLARMSVELGNAAKGEAYAQQDLQLTAKYSGKQSMEYSASLMTMGFVYSGEKEYAKAAPYFEEAVKYYEGLSGPGELTLLSAERVLCRDYDSLEVAAKSESCDREVLPLMEKYYGANNAALAPVLESQAKALRKLGREADAQAVEKRVHSLQQPVAGTNQ